MTPPTEGTGEVEEAEGSPMTPTTASGRCERCLAVASHMAEGTDRDVDRVYSAVLNAIHKERHHPTEVEA